MITAAALFIMLIHEYHLPAHVAAKMMCIAYEESKFDTKAINTFNSNGTTDIGLYQINSVWHNKCNNLTDVHSNIKCALMIYNKQGITAWSTYKKCV